MRDQRGQLRNLLGRSLQGLVLPCGIGKGTWKHTSVTRHKALPGLMKAKGLVPVIHPLSQRQSPWGLHLSHKWTYSIAYCYDKINKCEDGWWREQLFSIDAENQVTNSWCRRDKKASAETEAMMKTSGKFVGQWQCCEVTTASVTFLICSICFQFCWNSFFNHKILW